MAAPTLADVKARLRITSDAQDATLQDYLDGALAEYVEHVGPITEATYTATLGAGPTLLLPHAPVVEVTSVVDGSTLSLDDLTVDVAAGLVRWPAGADTVSFGAGTVVTYTAGGMPANHREAVLLDIEGLWRATQRGGGRDGARSSLVNGDDIYERANYSSPMTLYPRIRSLAGSASVA